MCVSLVPVPVAAWWPRCSQRRASHSVLFSTEAGPHAQVVDVLHQLEVGAIADDGREHLGYEACLRAVAALVDEVRPDVDPVLPNVILAPIFASVL